MLWIAVCCLAVYVLLLYCTRCRIVAVVLAGQSGQCTLEESLISYRQGELRRIGLPRVKTLRMVKEELDGCKLWESEQWRVWTPSAGPPWLGSEWPRTRYRTLDTSGELLIHPGDVVLDGGAYIGDSAIEALALGARQVISIEPSPRNLACLRRNLEEHSATGQVVVVEKGVWDREDKLTLLEHPTSGTADYIAGAGDRRHLHGRPHAKVEGQTTVTVPLTTIDKLVEELNLGRVDVIKLDIEGAEQRAIMGAEKTIARYKPRLAVAAYHLPDDREKIPALIRSIRPDYQMEGGRCLMEGWRIWAHLLYFH